MPRRWPNCDGALASPRRDRHTAGGVKRARPSGVSAVFRRQFAGIARGPGSDIIRRCHSPSSGPEYAPDTGCSRSRPQNHVREDIAMQTTRRGMLIGTAAAALAATGQLSATSPSLAATPATGKQAPGVYRHKLGDLELTQISDGNVTFPLAD